MTYGKVSVMSDELITEIAELMHRVRRDAIAWHELNERERMLMNMHYKMIDDALYDPIVEGYTQKMERYI